MDILLPTWLKVARLNTQYRDNTGLTRALYTAAPETTGFGGDRLRMSLEFTPTSSRQSAVERAALRSFLARLRGRQNRAYLWDPSYLGPRGSFSAPELLTNNTFANGTTGWTPSNSADLALSSADRVMRATRIDVPAGAHTVRAAVATTVQYAPYAARLMALQGRGAMQYNLLLGTAAGGSDVADGANYAEQGFRTLVSVAHGTSTHYSIGDSVTNRTSGDFVSFDYTSLARCALIDNGTNILLRSDEFDNAAWTKSGATVPSAVTAPDGTATGDFLREDSSAGQHYALQARTVASAVADYSLSVAVRSAGRNFVRLVIQEDTGSTFVSQFFNLGTGAVGATGSTGANWSNRRAFISDLGDDWLGCSLVGRKTNAATSLTVFVIIGSADGTDSYTGNSTDGISVWRATLAQSSVPTRLIETTTTASTGTSQTGNALHLKGLRAPGEGAASGLLLPDDRFEIITSRGSEMKIVTASLDSDAAGLGYIQFEPPLLGTPADNAPIIVCNPMTRAIFVGDMVGFEDSPGVLTTAAAEFEEA